MDKETLLQELSTKIHNSEISREEVMSRLNIPSTTQKEDGKDIKKFSHFSITKILYILGAAIVVIGVIIFIVQVWEDIGSFSRILITLGLGLLITAIGSVLLKQKREDNIGMIFHFIGGLLIPGGAIVTLHEFNVEIVSLWPFAITFGVIFAFYLLLNTIHKHAILTFFTIANGTAFIYLLFGAMIDDLLYRQQDLYAYLTMIIGVSYLLLGYAFRDGWNKKLIEVLYFLGIIGVLGAAFSQVFDSAFWESLYLFIVLGGLFLSVYMKSRIILVMSTLFLVAYISYITSEYFADSLGWPISLIILGFIFIGLGYASITINKKYIK